MKKNNNLWKLLTLSPILFASPIALLASSCVKPKEDPKPKPNPNNNQVLDETLNSLVDSVNVEFNTGVDRENVLASTVAKNDLSFNNLNGTEVEIINISGDDTSGTLSIVFNLKQGNKISKQRQISLTGFQIKRGGNNTPTSRIPGQPENSNTPEYRNASVVEKFRFDNDALNSALKAKLANDLGNEFSIPDTSNELYDVNRFNNNAKSTKNPDFESSYMKNWSLPTKGDQKLVISPLGTSIKAAYWDTKFYNGILDRGLPRYIPNEKYKDILLQTFEIGFFNTNDLLNNDQKEAANHNFLGTGWIIDYQIRNDNKYPTKWYIATNLHVALGLVKQNTNRGLYQNTPNIEYENRIYREKEAEIEGIIQRYNLAKAKSDENPNNDTLKQEVRNIELEYSNKAKEFKKIKESIMGETKNITLSHFNESTAIKQELKITSKDPNVDVFHFKPSQVNLIYAGINFLNSNPSSYVSNLKRDGYSDFSTLQEMADLAILEFDFENPENSYYFNNNNTNGPLNGIDASNLAKLATSSFALWDEKRKFKLANFDIYHEYDKLINEKVNYSYKDNSFTTSKMNLNFLALGFPNASSDYNLKKDNLTENDKILLNYTSSVWVNKRNDITSYLEDGLGLTNSLSSRPFIEKPGITDLLITNASLNSKTGFIVNNLKEKNSPHLGNEYINYGLGYSLKSWAPLSGASGSSVRDINNRILGINFAVEGGGNAGTSLIQALRSNGINYQGTYGLYNLEQYDLIYGGGRNQRSSYREALKAYYENQNITTYLFGNDLEHIPEEFQFK
ncbi:Ig-specific serine endopeptidase MIP [[Mycoplasma] anseris]|uniref:DUF31 domain-containing protein n=1 Tax=[Mycoplasma] anseris TaxID=92400 RepID=A0A2Z4NCV8_9BACT|nr:DUF31 family protein [[Mycoplasma] anseris]AWX69389.1 hypothetical protein DP065_01305 [[Mycoplasma] anseris]